MHPGDQYAKYAYEMRLIEYLESLPFWRKILARFFEKYKVTQKEFENVYYSLIKEA